MFSVFGERLFFIFTLKCYFRHGHSEYIKYVIMFSLYHYKCDFIVVLLIMTPLFTLHTDMNWQFCALKYDLYHYHSNI